MFSDFLNRDISADIKRWNNQVASLSGLPASKPARRKAAKSQKKSKKKTAARKKPTKAAKPRAKAPKPPTKSRAAAKPRAITAREVAQWKRHENKIRESQVRAILRQKRPRAQSKAIKANKTKAHILDFKAMKVNELKELLKSHGMRISGNKSELIQRCEGSPNLYLVASLKVKELQSELKSRGLKVSGSKTDLRRRLMIAMDAADESTEDEISEIVEPPKMRQRADPSKHMNQSAANDSNHKPSAKAGLPATRKEIGPPGYGQIHRDIWSQVIGLNDEGLGMVPQIVVCTQCGQQRLIAISMESLPTWLPLMNWTCAHDPRMPFGCATPSTDVKGIIAGSRLPPFEHFAVMVQMLLTRLFNKLERGRDVGDCSEDIHSLHCVIMEYMRRGCVGEYDMARHRARG